MNLLQLLRRDLGRLFGASASAGGVTPDARQRHRLHLLGASDADIARYEGVCRFAGLRPRLGVFADAWATQRDRDPAAAALACTIDGTIFYVASGSLAAARRLLRDYDAREAS